MEPVTEIKIEVPAGKMIDVENSTFTHIKFKDIEKQLPKRWEDLDYIYGYFVNSNSTIEFRKNKLVKYMYKNIFPTVELAEATLALAQLLQLRDTYNDDWNPNWNNMNETKYVIYIKSNNIEIGSNGDVHRVLSFKSLFLVKEFLKNFKDLIEIAKPLL